MEPATPKPSKKTMGPKAIFTLDLPFSDTLWPPISTDAQSSILQLLCIFLSPIGDCRSGPVVCSRGKRIKKRKRKGNFKGESFPTKQIQPASQEAQNFVTIGFNSTTRYLEALAQNNISSCLPNGGLDSSFKGPTSLSKSNISCSEFSKMHRPLVAIFVSSPEQTPILYAHLPALIKTASLASSVPPISLVALPKGAEASLSKALKLPRIGLLGLLEGAPGASELTELIRTQVPSVVVPWLEIAEAGRFLPTKIHAVHASNPTELEQDRHDRKSSDPKETTASQLVDSSR